MEIGVIGAGSWGTALACLLAEKNYRVTLWVRRYSLYKTLLEKRENSDYLKGVKVPEQVEFTTDLEKAVRRKDLIVLTVPSHAVREITGQVSHFVNRNTVVVNAAKGLEQDSLLRMSEVIHENIDFLPKSNIVVISGPNHAEEVSRHYPSATVVATEDRRVAEFVQDVFMTPNFRVYTNNDKVGVELGGALKNVIAISAGICDGLGFGDNTKAALMTRGLTEITRLGVAMGALARTFSGLSGLGDLFVTCTSKHSRNRYVGVMIGLNHKLEDILAGMNMVAEGVRTTRAAYLLAREYNIEMPITEELHEVLFKKKKPQLAVKTLMQRNKTREIEETPF